jgi:septum formation protein
MTTIFLASTSPRRRELLAQLGVNFDVISIDIDEAVLANEKPVDYVSRVAKEKAQAGWAECRDVKSIVIAADTSVIIDQQILGKPKNLPQAQAMLALLSGRTHQVISVVALMSEKGLAIKLNENTVRFSKLTEQKMAWYLATQEGMDKAGGYAVQGLAARFIEHIEGSYSGIMGLPLHETAILLEQAGYRYE